MKNNKKTSITLALATVLGLSFTATNADAQNRRGGSGYQNNNGYNSNSSRSQRSPLRQDVYAINQLSSQMTSQFSREMRDNRGCRESIALLNHMQTYTGKTANLVRAYNGTCKVTLKKAACEARDTLSCVQKQAKRVRNLSRTTNSMISQSTSLASRVHKNADRFSPANVNNSPRGGYASQNTTPSRGAYSRNNQNSSNRTFGSILRAAINR